MDLVLALSHVALAVTMLAHQAWLMIDAVVRSLTRLYVTRRRLLEWVPAARARSGLDLTLKGLYVRLASAPLLAGIAAVIVLLVHALRPSLSRRRSSFSGRFRLRSRSG